MFDVTVVVGRGTGKLALGSVQSIVQDDPIR